MAERGEYKFHIDVFTPLTLPMTRLKDYIVGLVELFGNDDFVHFLRVDEGTAAPACYVEPRILQKVEHRLTLIKSGGADDRAMNAFTFLNDKLFDDNAVAELTDHQGQVLYFPGRESIRAPEIGPITELGVLEGEVFQIGGKERIQPNAIASEYPPILLHARQQLFFIDRDEQAGQPMAEQLA